MALLISIGCSWNDQRGEFPSVTAAMPQLLDMLPGARGSWERWFTPQQGAIQAAESLITVVVHVFMEECNSIVAGISLRNTLCAPCALNALS